MQQVAEIFNRYGDKKAHGFYLSIWDNKVDTRRQLHDLLNPIISPKSKELFVDYKILLNCFAVKNNQPASSWPVHQDDSFTDESKFSSLSIWVPLTDVDQNNGAMKILEGSHNKYKAPRSPTIPKPFAGEEDKLLAQMRTVCMKAGQALIFDHRLLHASGDNASDQPRVVAVSVLIPQEAPIWFYYRKNGTTEIIRLDEDYYQKFQLGERPEGKVEFFLTTADIASGST